LRVTNVNRNGVGVLYDGSMPAIRVQYNGNACGPYVDRIKWDNLVADPATGNKVRSAVNSDYIRIWVEAQIASYHLVQSWYFYKTLGVIVPELQSSGLQCTTDHRHHPYWHLDVDVAGSGFNRIVTWNAGVGTTRTNEFNTTKAAAGSNVYFYNNNNASKTVLFNPGVGDGTPDTFATWDYGGRRFPSSLNDPWAPTSTGFTDTGDLESATSTSTTLNNENINGQDIVFWYNAHLVHLASGGPTQVGAVGPVLWLSGF
jgi:hypothetical protein